MKTEKLVKGDQVKICITKGGGSATVVRTTHVGAMTTKGFYLFNDIEKFDPMNTEQLKTAEEILNHHYVHDNMMTQQKGWIINAMNSFASQESKIAVDEFKEKLKAEILSMRNNRRVVTANWTLQEAIDLIDKL